LRCGICGRLDRGWEERLCGARKMERYSVDVKEAAQHLAAIRRIMESAVELTVLPGKGAVAGGALALAGCAATYWRTGSWDVGVLAAVAPSVRGQIIGIWAAVVIVAAGCDVLLMARTAAKRGLTPWSRLGQMVGCVMGPAILTGGLLTVGLIMHGAWRVIPSVWMLVYGSAVWVSSMMSVRVPRAFGAFFFVGGVITLFWASQVGLLMVAATFGLGHVVCGIYLAARFGD